MQDLLNTSNDAESRAMQDAIFVLREIQVAKLGYPEGKRSK